MRLEISVLSEPGGRQRNEDACGFWAGGDCTFAVVSDGAGGHGGGDVASRLAVGAILSSFRENPVCSSDAVDDALRIAHRAIVEQQPTRQDLAGMRATATVLAVDAAHRCAVWGHVGDTRLYCFRDGGIVFQTKDHSVVQRMVDAGYLAQAAIRRSRQRSKLFAALGHNEDCQATVERAVFPVRVGDAFLLCTDGFWEHVEESTMLATLAQAKAPADWIRDMADGVVQHGGQGQDNFSALAIFCTDAAAAARGDGAANVANPA